MHARQNQYPGVNPHLNSALQQPGGGWKGFHSKHITHLAAYLDDVLPPFTTQKKKLRYKSECMIQGVTRPRPVSATQA